MNPTGREYPSKLKFLDLVTGFFRRIWFLGSFLLGLVVIAVLLFWGFFAFLWETLVKLAKVWTGEFMESLMAGLVSLGCSGFTFLFLMAFLSLFVPEISIYEWTFHLEDLSFLYYFRFMVCFLFLLAILKIPFDSFGKIKQFSTQPFQVSVDWAGQAVWFVCLFIIISGESWVRAYLISWSPHFSSLLALRDQFGWWLFLSLLLLSYPFYLLVSPMKEERKRWALFDFARNKGLHFSTGNKPEFHISEEIENLKSCPEKGEICHVVWGDIVLKGEEKTPIKFFDWKGEEKYTFCLLEVPYQFPSLCMHYASWLSSADSSHRKKLTQVRRKEKNTPAEEFPDILHLGIKEFDEKWKTRGEDEVFYLGLCGQEFQKYLNDRSKSDQWIEFAPGKIVVRAKYVEYELDDYWDENTLSKGLDELLDFIKNLTLQISVGILEKYKKGSV